VPRQSELRPLVSERIAIRLGFLHSTSASRPPPRGGSRDLLARETGQPAGRISAWREEFLAGGREGLKSRPALVEDRRLAEAQRKVGELTMDLDILRALNDEMDRHPQSPRRSV